MKTITVRFLRDKSFFSRLICWYTQSEWSHVEFVTPTGYLGAMPQGGVQIRDFNYTDVSAEEFRSIQVFNSEADKFWLWAYAQIGKPYDWTAIFGLLLHRNWRNQGHWFCSEMVTQGFEIAGVKILDTAHINFITPRDVALTTILKKVN